MRMLLFLAVVTLASADNAQQWATTIDTDKSDVNSKIKSLEDSAKAMTLLEQDHSKIHGFANEAQHAATDAYQTRIQDAQGTYKTAQSYLNSLPAGSNTTDAVNKVRETGRKLHQLEE